jgi:tight adherence protein B
VPQALRSLEALVEAGLPLPRALAAWPAACPGGLRPAATAVAARVALGDAPARALGAAVGELGDDALTLAAIAELHAVSGCDAARLLDVAARQVERRESLAGGAAVATSGAKLSGRMVAVLPMLALLAAPTAGVRLFDRRGALLLVCGVALLLVGVWWIARLLPRAPARDGVAELATFLAAALGAGVDLHAAMHLCAASATPSLRAQLVACVGRVRMGAGWSHALGLADDDGLRTMAAVLGRAEELGTPIRRSLLAFAGARERAAEAAFDRATRRAPVLMVVPLTVCILPAYLLLAVGPFLRGLSWG